MKLKKFEICLIAAAVIMSSFCIGYFTGRSDPKRVISVDTGGITVSTEKGGTSQPGKKDGGAHETETDNKKNDIPEYPVNINKASEEELAALPGIGDVLAGRIIEYREKNGSFSDASEIMEVYGIGDSKYDMIKDHIFVD